METRTRYVIGVDYGTDSCRAILVDARTGEEVAKAVSYYRRWSEGLYCDPGSNSYRQHPLDYMESLEEVIADLLEQCPEIEVSQITGMGFDTTGSTPVLLDQTGSPLALLPEFTEDPDAMFVLWKDHTAVKEADEINALAKKWEVDYTAYSGGVYSSEWVWSKMLHLLRVNPAVRAKAYSWAEHCDWMPALLTGNTTPETMPRSRCAAGHKAMWNARWGGLPSFDFLKALDPLMGLFEGHLFTDTFTSDQPAGKLTAEWAARLGLTTEVVVCIGELDCHMGAVGAQVSAGAFVRIIGTSTCDIMVASPERLGDRPIAGICGQVDGSVIPGLVGLEAGQSAFGDLYAWFRNIISDTCRDILATSPLLTPEMRLQLEKAIKHAILPYLNEEAAKLPLLENSPVAVDWMNGRRTPFANQNLTGSITGLTLGSSAPVIFRALVEATAFGSKAIVESILDQGVEIREMIGIGGIPLKSPFVMQTLADVLEMPIKVAGAEQACALGAAMFAAVAAGIYPRIEDAQWTMGKGFTHEYYPVEARSNIYRKRYIRYCKAGKFIEENLD